MLPDLSERESYQIDQALIGISGAKNSNLKVGYRGDGKLQPYPVVPSNVGPQRFQPKELGPSRMKSAKTGFEIVPLTELPTKRVLVNRDKPVQMQFEKVPRRNDGPDSMMGCEEKARLLGEYNVATVAFSEAVNELHRRIGTSPLEEYKRLERISGEARVKSEQTRLALEQHIAAHDC
jgi:hypothetical protein